MYDIIAILIPIVLAVAIVMAIRIIADAGMRKRLAETQTDPEVIRVMLDSGRKHRERSILTWGIMALLLGQAIVLIGVFDIQAEDPLAYGLLFCAAGIGLVASLIAGRFVK